MKLRTLLEKAIVHLLNGDETKAAALFHKFMVERARQIHESIRQDDDTDEALDENWDQEITEEEYFGDDDLNDEPEAVDGPPPDDDPEAMPMDDMTADDGAEMHADADADMPDDEFGADDDMGDDLGGEPDVEGKIDELADKIDDLTAEFDRMMAEFHDEEPVAGDDMGADADMADDGMPPADDFGSDEPDVEDETDDLADNLGDDMVADDDDDDHEHPVAEGAEEPPASAEEGGDDDDLQDITESVLAELDKIGAPSNSEGKGVGSVSQPSNITNNKNSPVPHHNVMDRQKGEPVMTKGPNHDHYNKEPSPAVKPPTTVVKDVRKPNRRNSFKDTMHTVSPKGDASAELNKDFASGTKASKSIIGDGKPVK
jgi:hypothetical protein